MRTRVGKWGNSLAIRIPRSFAEEAQVAEETVVELTLVEGGLLVRPVRSVTPGLEALLQQVSEDNLHSEQDFGPAAGREVW
ncbi:MAG: AbrB/MazE/SpoVT family DNA-binding domain-containing protein [Armatimonadota bacterium]